MPTPIVPPTRHRTFRAPDDLWQAAQEVAAEQGETLTDCLVRALLGYVTSHGRDVPPSQRQPSRPSS